MHRPLFSRVYRRQDSSLALSKAPKTPQMASKTDLGGHQSRQDGPICPQDDPRGPKEAPRALQADPQEGPKRHKSLIFIFYVFFHGIASAEFPTLQDGRRGPQDRPKTAQEAPKRVPRRPKRASRRPNRRTRQPNRAPILPQKGHKKGTANLISELLAQRGVQETPSCAHELPKRPQDGPKGRQDAPRGL